MGDPSGIGPEIVARALADARVRRALVPVVFGDGPSLRRLEGAQVRAVTRLPAADRRPGKPSRAGGRAQLQYVRAAVAAARAGEVDALCTAPVSKEQISRSGERFVGHTELLAESFGRDVLMLLDGPRLKVALATNHVSIRDLPRALTRGRVAGALLLLDASLRPLLGRAPRLAVCGLNPHAGDGGLLGREDGAVIAPAMRDAARRGVQCEGPFAADGLFASLLRARRSRFDAVLAMFHDQGLVVVKALDFEHTVNVTLGLPLPRTSPDHGVAYDIAGKGRADAEPMISALLKAADLARARPFAALP
ncbi:MAG TPA: 4-hydroxythreonine-4-phosphate dehydrogenase PdxA [Myxococcales bacterium]|nr:4-hydroxythreonine-4-phosphate dehydrogenase PdxA [Myxococcales bacterium]